MVGRENQFHVMYMNIAKEISSLSHAKRKKVGCICVKDGSIVSYGYNGTPYGYHTNECEVNNVTSDVVVHAEQNCLMKIAASTTSSVDSILYMTMSPCINCAKLICQAKIKEVYFFEVYRENDGIELLKNSNIKCYQIIGNLVIQQ